MIPKRLRYAALRNVEDAKAAAGDWRYSRALGQPVKGKTMKKVLLLIALAAASSVCAQAPEPAREPATLPATEAAKAPATSTVARRSRRMQDARHCLERPTNTEIIKCAEAYL